MKQYNGFLRHKAYKLRAESLTSTTAAGSGHPTSCLSAADLVAALFFYNMQYDPQHFDNPDNDRFVLSKGHAAPLLYAAWKEVLGKDFAHNLDQLRAFDSVLEGHPVPRFGYVEAATGSLGQGLSIGVGLAMNAKLDDRAYHTYVLLGDSEMTEGSNWEAIQIASYYGLGNLIAIIDVNRLGQSTATIEGHDLDNYRKKFEAFGWQAIEVYGHDMQEITQALSNARIAYDQPVVVIARTVKGYGINAEIEGEPGFHGKAMSKERLPKLLDKLKQRFYDAACYAPDQVPEPVNFRHNADEQSTSNTMQWGMPKSAYKKTDALPTRVAFGQALAAAGGVVSEIISLDAEVKNSTYAEIFEEKFPDRFIQCYIAEQNMIGMGVGLQVRGKIPFCSTFAAFMSRAHDQIRMAAVSRCPLRLVGSHAGVSIGADGPSQMGLEDIAMMRCIIDSIVLYPCDAVSAYKCVEQQVRYTDGISYLRTTRMKTPVIYDNTESFALGDCKVLRSSEDDKAVVVGAGVTLFEALKAHEQLQNDDIHIAVIDCYCVKPLPREKLLKQAQKAGNRIIVVEDHYAQGGIGEAIAVSLSNTDVHVVSCAVTKMPRSGTPEDLLAYEGIDAAGIVSAVKEHA